MNIWEQLLEIIDRIKGMVLGLSAEQITLISVLVTLIIFVVGQRSEAKFKKHEVRRTEYKKFIALLEQSFTGGMKKVDPDTRKAFFDTGVSLLLYGSKRVYKKYVFFREYTTNPIVQRSKHNDGKVLMYVIADILKAIRHEVGLTSVSELEANEVLSFIVNDVGTNPLSRIDSYKAQYNIFMIKCEMFFFNRFKLLTTRKVYYHFIKPVFGVISMLVKSLLLPIGRLVIFVSKGSECKKIPKKEKRQSTMDRFASKCDKSKLQEKQGLVAKVFALEWKAQNWVVHNIWRKSELFWKIDKICFLGFLVCIFIFGMGIVPFDIIVWIACPLCVAMIVLDLIKDTKKAMTTLGGFLRVGIYLTMFLLIFILATATLGLEQLVQGATDLYYVFIIISVLLSLFWGTYSSFCNAEVATLANALLTCGIGIIVLTKDLLVKTLCIERPVIFISEKFMADMASIGFNSSQTIDGVLSLLFYPILLMVGWATMVCAAKKYWINKYNNGKDIDSVD